MPRSKPPYSDEFRKEAVDLLLSSGKPLKRGLLFNLVGFSGARDVRLASPASCAPVRLFGTPCRAGHAFSQ